MLTCTLFNLIFLLSLNMIFLNHPLSIGLFLLMMTIILALTSGIALSNFWISYILSLIFIGAMLVLFMYMISLANNEKFKFNFKIMYMNLIFIFIMFLTYLFYTSPLMNNNLLSVFNLEFCISDTLSPSSIFLSIEWSYQSPFNILIIFLACYLLLVLLIVSKIMELNKGSLRSI